MEIKIKPLETEKEMNSKQFRIVTFKTFRTRFKRVAEQNTHEYFKNTSIHGLHYITNGKLLYMERAFFGIAFLSVVFVSMYFVQNVYNKWNRNPIIVSINPKYTFITMEPFPAVTICNLNQAYKSKVENYSIYSTEYARLQMLCKREVNLTIAETITDWSNINDFILDIAQPCSNMLLSCHFGAIKYNCSELFHPIITNEGLCCTFNMVHPKFTYKPGTTPVLFNLTQIDGLEAVNWNEENGYQQNLPNNFFPRTSVGVGVSLGLTVMLDVESEKYYCSSSNSIGFKFLLHSPTEIPKAGENGFLISAGYETNVRIKPEKFQTEANLRVMSKQRRGCLFQDEYQLKIFSFYTPTNCEMECTGKLMLEMCGCISHFLPRLRDNDTICSIYEASCIERVRLNSMRNFAQENCAELCLPGCNELKYNPVIFTSPLSHEGFAIVSQVLENISSDYVGRNIAEVKLYFKEYAFRSNKQAEYTGSTDALFDWNSEKGYPKSMPKNFYPRTGVGVGESLGLTLILDVEADKYYCSSSNSVGFKVLVHSPAEIPNAQEIGLLISPGFETKVRLQTQKSESVPSLRAMSRERRRCLFQDEENLNIFTYYTPDNCEMECIAKLLLDICGCISNFMPKLRVNDTICSIYDVVCMERVRLNSMQKSRSNNCAKLCLPGCNDIDFSPHIFSSPLSHSGFQIVNQVLKNISNDYVQRNIAELKFYQKEYGYKSLLQTELTGSTDALSSLGGLMVLFFGFSFLSLMELAFYAFVRPCRREREHKVKQCISEKNISGKLPPLRKRAGKRFTPRFEYYPQRLHFKVGKPPVMFKRQFKEVDLETGLYRNSQIHLAMNQYLP